MEDHGNKSPPIGNGWRVDDRQSTRATLTARKSASEGRLPEIPIRNEVYCAPVRDDRHSRFGHDERPSGQRVPRTSVCF